MIRSCCAPVFILLLSAAVPAQAKVWCDACKGKGCRPCKNKIHRRILHWEDSVEFCSVAGSCETCGGSYTVDCKTCRNPAVENAAAARRDLVKKWIASRRESVDKFTRTQNLLHARTKHFDLAFGLAPMRIGKNPRKRSQHELMHIWLDRMESLYAQFCKVFELKDDDFAVRVDLYMFEKQADHVEIAPRKIGSDAGNASGKKYMGDKMIFSMWRKPKELRNDEDLKRYMRHHVTHLFVNHMAPHTWIFNKGHGWIDAGVAHWFEYQANQLATNYCYEEVALDFSRGWKGGKWKVAIRLLVDAHKQIPFAEFFQKNTDQLSVVAHAHCFAYVDFLITTRGGAKMRDLIRAVKAKTPIRDALKKVYGLNPILIEKEFAEFIKEKYPRKEPRRRG